MTLAAAPRTANPKREPNSAPHSRARQTLLATHKMSFKLSVGMTNHPEYLEIDGLFTQGSRPGRNFDESIGGILEMDSYDWSNGFCYHIFDTRPDTEFNSRNDVWNSVG